MKKIRSGDEVLVIAGKNKGSTGKVLRFVEKKDKRGNPLGTWVIVQGVNLVKKHVKPNPQAKIDGGFVSKEAPLHYSNIQLWDPAGNTGSRVGIRTLEEGVRVRYFKSTGEVVNV